MARPTEGHAWWVQTPIQGSDKAVDAPPTSQIAGLSTRLPPLTAAEKEKERPAPPKYKVRDHLRFQIQIIPS